MKFGLPLAVLALASSAAAHFTLDYPTTRGFDEDKEDDNFCGGFSNVSLPRQPWYYRNGPVQIDSHHDSATVNIYISFDVPTGSESFLKTSNGTSVPPLRQNLAIKGEGEFCFHANASSLDVPGVRVADGTNATIMVEFISVHGHLYQCSDVSFTSNASVGANLTCTDSLTSGSTSSSSNSSSASPASTSSTPAPSKANGAVATALPRIALLVLPALLAGALASVSM
ncbi:uncharacterized protein PAN0_017c5467 [Moesziomyces antarcticus]|uniref:Uncharacterized protein n=2 Tax=Pseudozyma antarctica TaxID=84753 RepID=A0A5C3FX15_PSEA2|nr:uncharacterized protein PAN0_017c5467 [Moesziomyces antarcticus]GAK67240.1 conserved hypothetical protein [Moesziomyces antarcticus]SPO48151.1 uncharacterized protein PSANT_05839 [Moesziomyces antarcticus]